MFNHSSTQWESLSTCYQYVPGSDSYLGWGGTLQLKAIPGGPGSSRHPPGAEEGGGHIIIDMQNWN